MSHKGAPRSTLLIAIFGLIISLGTCCTIWEWTCDSGQCIASHEVCDGIVNCADESDETSALCIDCECPTYAFRCNYGACVIGTAECNGIKECADNSDELTDLCQSDDDIVLKHSFCTEDQFECENAKCIDLENLCNGVYDCEDGTDEHVNVCGSIKCPSFAFRCGYGACISVLEKCNGVESCVDGSDENPELCRKNILEELESNKTISLNKSEQEHNSIDKLKDHHNKPHRPENQDNSVNQSEPHNYTDTGIKSTNGSCKAPKVFNCRLLYESKPNVVIEPGDNLPDFTKMSYECTDGRSLRGVKTNICINSKWQTREHPKCLKYCPAKLLAGLTYTVNCIKHGVSVSCRDHIEPGTIAIIRCRYKYKKPNWNPPDLIRCGHDGEWDYEPFTCEPECGEELFQSDDTTNTTVVPWHVGIYKKTDGTHTYICGGTIINAKIIVTAANCFRDDGTEIDRMVYTVVAGKLNNDFYNHEETAQFQNISAIYKGPQFNVRSLHPESNIAVVVLTNSLRFSKTILPICMEWQQKVEDAIRNNIKGQTAIWDLNHYFEFLDNVNNKNLLQTVNLDEGSSDNCYEYLSRSQLKDDQRDKFCIAYKNNLSISPESIGGGFTVKNNNVRYLWGIVSAGVPLKNTLELIVYTNIQYYEAFVMDREFINRPK